MQAGSRRVLLVALAGALLVAGGWFLLFGFQLSAPVSVESKSMSHAEEHLDGVLDPGEWVSFDPVERPSEITTYYEARPDGYRYGEDFGDVIVFDAVSRGEPVQGLGIVHRAIAWVEYNETADAYDIPVLGIRGQHQIVFPDVGTYDPALDAYVHRNLEVVLLPGEAGRHDGFLTKGDHNQPADQDARASFGGGAGTPRTLELVTLEHLDGRVTHHIETSTTNAILWGVPAGSLVLAGGYYAWVRAGRPGVGRVTTPNRCRACGAKLDPQEAFCPACGTERGE